jgi:hypothetical protein
LCGSYVRILALLGAASEQYHQPVAVLAEVNSIAGAKVDSVFKNTGTKTLNIREVALPHAIERYRHFDGSCYIQVIEPFGIGTIAIVIKVFSYFNHTRLMVTFLLPSASLFGTMSS